MHTRKTIAAPTNDKTENYVRFAVNVFGLKSPDLIGDLKDSSRLKEDLGYDPISLQSLQKGLDSYVHSHQPGKHVTLTELRKITRVDGVIRMVREKLAS